jgi:hypothetical protein
MFGWPPAIESAKWLSTLTIEPRQLFGVGVPMGVGTAGVAVAAAAAVGFAKMPLYHPRPFYHSGKTVRL